MNKKHRAAIAKAIAAIEAIKDELVTIQDEEQEAFDNMPEPFQETQKGEMAETAISAIEDTIGNLEEAIENLNNAKE